MTLENILEQFATNIVLNPNKAQDAKQQAILDLKQYAREMCDKQKLECGLQWSGVGSDDLQLNCDAILDAPYPKELE